jgi:exonuclease VII small subunit
MDVEKTMQFIVEQQGKFEANQASLNESLVRLEKRQEDTERLINAFAKAGQAQIELHTARLDGLEGRLEIQEREFKAFLDRFDAYLRRAGNGNGA